MTEIEEATAKFNKKQEERRKRPYFDHLHVPSEKLVVTYNGQEMCLMNKFLLDRQECWENLEAIKETHWLKFMFYEMILESDDSKELKELAKDIQECEFELQELWKFPRDARYHRFWDTPKCKCPRMDNNDDYPSGFYSISPICPLHGD